MSAEGARRKPKLSGKRTERMSRIFHYSSRVDFPELLIFISSFFILFFVFLEEEQWTHYSALCRQSTSTFPTTF